LGLFTLNKNFFSLQKTEGKKEEVKPEFYSCLSAQDMTDTSGVPCADRQTTRSDSVGILLKLPQGGNIGIDWALIMPYVFL